MTIKLVIFDLDDVLIKSRKFIVGSFEYTLRRLNLPTQGLSHPMMQHCTLHQAHAHLGITSDMHDEAVRLHTEFQKDNLHLLEVAPTTVPTLKTLQSQFKIAIVSNRHKNGGKLLEHCDLRQYIELLIGAEDVVEPKPNPEGIHKVMKHFGVEPEHTVMVGDASTDIMAGNAADVWTIGLDTGYSLETLQKAGPDFIIKDLSELIPLLASK